MLAMRALTPPRPCVSESGLDPLMPVWCRRFSMQLSMAGVNSRIRFPVSSRRGLPSASKTSDPPFLTMFSRMSSNPSAIWESLGLDMG